jgi:hypothetical protein
MNRSKKTLSASAKKQAKGKSVKIVKKSLPKAKAVALKKANRLTKKKVKTVAAKTPAKQKAKAVVVKKAKAPVKPATKGKAFPKGSPGIKKVSTPVKQKAKAVVAKKANAPFKSATKGKVAKKTSTPEKQKAKVVVASKEFPGTKKIIDLKKGGERNAKLKAKTSSSEVKAKIVTELPLVPPIEIHGEDLHFIPEHEEITQPVTPLEAHKKETIFQHKEEVAFHQENQKVRNALPSRKTMKVFNRNRGVK